MSILRRLFRAITSLYNKSKDNPLNEIDWLVPQLKFLQCTDKVKLLRGGNQAIGKTWAGVAECIMLALGRHPYQPGRTCKEIWVICASWSQSVAIQKKMYLLAPKDQLLPSQRFDEVNGFGGHQPALKFKNGSYILIKTTNQGSLSLAGASIDHALFDEPPAKPRHYMEVLKRVQSNAGTLSLCLTPVNAPCEWLRKQCDEGKIRDLHFRLEPENLIHVKTGRPRCLPDGTYCDEEWIRKVRAETLPNEDSIVNDGEWESRALERMFIAFQNSIYNRESKTGHVIRTLPDLKVILSIGIDHGKDLGRETAVVVGVEERPGQHPRILALAEYSSNHMTTPEQDAANIAAMMQHLNIGWEKLTYAYGDRPTGMPNSVSRKGNYDIEDHLSRAFGLKSREQLKPRILSTKQGVTNRGSVTMGVKFLHSAMLNDGCFQVSSECPRLIEALNKWDGTPDSEYKDIIDALRYALRPWIFKERAVQQQQKPVIKNW